MAEDIDKNSDDLEGKNETPSQVHGEDSIKNDVFHSTIKTINKLRTFLEEGIWEKSFLLKHKKKKITSAIDELEESMADLNHQVINVDNIIEQKKASHKIPEGDVLVYITLYQASGKDLMMWQITCNAISTCGFGRPIYLEEKNAMQWVKSKGEKTCDGYVIVHVPKEAVIDLDKDETEMLDSLNNKLVHIKPGYLGPDKIVKFVHFNQSKYYFIDGKLIVDDG